MIKNKIIKTCLPVVFGCFLAGAGCRNACDNYKQIACENRNSPFCHEAMQKIPDMSLAECREKILIIKSDIKSSE